MPSVTFRTPLSPQEQDQFQKEFKRLDPEDLGIVTGEAVKPLFNQSGLSAQLLSQIWDLCDTDNQGFLNVSQFNAAMRIIGHLQANPTLAVTSELYQDPASNTPATPTAQMNLAATDTGSSNTNLIPAISPYDVSKFSQLFDRTTNGSPTLAGDKARDIFLKAKLPTPTLGSVWNICDRKNSGALDKQEFIMAMHLIQLAMANNPALASLPEVLPNYLWDSVSAAMLSKPALSANSTGFSLNSPVSHQPSLNRVPSSAFSNAASDWTLSHEKKQQFDAIFDSLDKTKGGTLSSQVLVPFFLSSRLNQDTLATVWDLADIHNNAEFSNLEFAIAMFLIQKKKSGLELPDVVPEQLLRSPALGLYAPDPQQARNSQNLSGQLPSIPSRDTKPSFSESPQLVQRNQSALGDLLTLNESFSSPKPEQARMSSTTTASSMNSAQSPVLSGSTVGMRRFQPSSTFGQSIIREEPVTATPDGRPAPQDQTTYFQAQPSFQQTQAEQQNQQAQHPTYQQSSQQLPSQEKQNYFDTNSASNSYQGASQSNAQPVSRDIPPTAQQSSHFSPLPNVPNFSSPSLQQGSRYASSSMDGEPSMQLSQATTELANLSNQVSSLTNQATLVNERKTKAQQELKRITTLKSSIESKMITLRNSYEQELKQTEQTESQLLQSRQENEELQRQLSVAEANLHAVQGSLSELQQKLQESQMNNAQLKENIANLNSTASSLQAELAEKQQKVKQERSMVDVNSKQMELSGFTVANLKSEIEGLEQHLGVFLQKHKELDDYRTTLENQHGELNNRHQQLEGQHTDISRREKELQERNKEIETQEQLYHQEIAKLQSMFKDLNSQRESFANADDELQSQQLQYAQKVQELSERQMKLAMGELPEDAEDVIKSQRGFSSSNDHVAKFVEDSVTNSQLGTQEDDENKQESDVFDKDVPTVGSQTEVEEEDARTHDDETAAQVLADRFDGDLNEYRIPRTESVTSSVLNNPPQSVCDYPEGDIITGAATGDNEQLAKSADVEKTMPGGWADARNVQNGERSANGEHRRPIDPESEIETLKKSPDQTLDESSTVAEQTIEDEFPPIQELDIEESDSSDDNEDEEFKGSKYVARDENSGTKDKSVTMANTSVAATPAVLVSESQTNSKTLKPDSGITPLQNKEVSEFEDAFDGLEQAAPEEDTGLEVNDHEFPEDFEQIEHKDLDDELNQGGFTGASGPVQGAQAVDFDPAAVGADEWDEIFAGFGNSKQGSAPVAQPEPMPIKQPVPTKSSEKIGTAPINRGIATTPKSLAVEELGSMGFSAAEATKALEQCNWDLGAATNHLLDSS
ncbi:LANO_0B03840g1_1 [Lachancea nothofagi CBS 11611]|uniref:LANO_0B03840g1_1 n=1 Tax=Lachancea nothofagi CBS 11611 TaxID=1266666 RepID=A0A1G4IX14_9SACH|nr:LANO_0B03840g1_1 [Lachancea nothofagi CBS 11611]